MLPLTTIPKDKILKVLKLLILLLFAIVYLYLMVYYIPKVNYERGYNDGVANVSNSSSTPSINTELEVSTKKSPTDPDLILNNNYSAVINGTKVEVPIANKNIKESLESSTDGATGTTATAKVEQTIDLTPIFKNYEPKRSWEFGVGIGCLDGKVYMPIDIQRNFSYNKALELQLNVRDKKIDGATLSYKIRF